MDLLNDIPGFLVWVGTFFPERLFPIRFFSIWTWGFYLGPTGLLFWLLYVLRVWHGRTYTVYTEPFQVPFVVVAVNYREPEDNVRASIRSVLSGVVKPEVYVIVFNGQLVGYEHALAEEYRQEGVHFRFLEKGDKRYAQADGIRYIAQLNEERNLGIEVVVLMDGDTLWEEDTSRELLKPFTDNRIDAVASAQVIDNPDESLWTMITALLTHWGHEVGQKWQSVIQSSSCLRGRTNAFRLSALTQPGFLEEFADWYFMDWKYIGHLGRKLNYRRISGDDGTLTFLVLKYNWLRQRKLGGTFLQMSSRIHTLAEPGFEKFIKMRVRCMSNTYTRYFDAIFRSWFWAQKWRFKLEFVVSVIIPLSFIICTAVFTISIGRIFYYLAIGDFFSAFAEGLVPTLFYFTWYNLGRFIRAPKWAMSNKQRLKRWPALILVFLFILSFARWWTVFSLLWPQQGWGTRHGSTIAVSRTKGGSI